MAIANVFQHKTVKGLIIFALVYGLVNNVLYFSSYFTNGEQRAQRAALIQGLDQLTVEFKKSEVDLTTKRGELVQVKATFDQLKKEIESMEKAGVETFPAYEDTVRQYNQIVSEYDQALKDYQKKYGDYLNQVETYNQKVVQYNQISLITEKRYTIPSYLQQNAPVESWFDWIQSINFSNWLDWNKINPFK